MNRLRVVLADLKITCAEPAGRVAQADGDFATAIANDRVVVKSLEEDGEYGSDAWVSANYSLATALGMSSDNVAILRAGEPRLRGRGPLLRRGVPRLVASRGR